MGKFRELLWHSYLYWCFQVLEFVNNLSTFVIHLTLMVPGNSCGAFGPLRVACPRGLIFLTAWELMELDILGGSGLECLNSQGEHYIAFCNVLSKLSISCAICFGWSSQGSTCIHQERTCIYQWEECQRIWSHILKLPYQVSCCLIYPTVLPQ